MQNFNLEKIILQMWSQIFERIEKFGLKCMIKKKSCKKVNLSVSEQLIFQGILKTKLKKIKMRLN